jgi:hypothetical protein
MVVEGIIRVWTRKKLKIVEMARGGAKGGKMDMVGGEMDGGELRAR